MATSRKTVSEDADWRTLLADVLTRLPAYLKLGWSLAGSPELPRRSRLRLLGGALYSVSPVDLVPGIIPVLGQLDDLAILLQSIRSALRHCPRELAERSLRNCGLTEEQLDQDLRTLGRVAKEFSRVIAKGAWHGSRRVGAVIGRGVASGARAIWQSYQDRKRTR